MCKKAIYLYIELKFISHTHYTCLSNTKKNGHWVKISAQKFRKNITFGKL